jgi:hypothetical protein
MTTRTPYPLSPGPAWPVPLSVLWESVSVLEGVRVTLDHGVDTAASRCEHAAAARYRDAAARVVAVQRQLIALTQADQHGGRPL